jgi:hypothetical protein
MNLRSTMIFPLRGNEAPLPQAVCSQPPRSSLSAHSSRFAGSGRMVAIPDIIPISSSVRIDGDPGIRAKGYTKLDIDAAATPHRHGSMTRFPMHGQRPLAPPSTLGCVSLGASRSESEVVRLQSPTSSFYLFNVSSHSITIACKVMR